MTRTLRCENCGDKEATQIFSDINGAEYIVCEDCCEDLTDKLESELTEEH